MAKTKKNLEERLTDVPPIPKLDTDYSGAGGESKLPSKIGPLDDKFLPITGPGYMPLNTYEERVKWMGYVELEEIRLQRRKWKGKADNVRLTLHRQGEYSVDVYVDPEALPDVRNLRKEYVVVPHKGRELVMTRCGWTREDPENENAWFVRKSELPDYVLKQMQQLR